MSSHKIPPVEARTTATSWSWIRRVTGSPMCARPTLMGGSSAVAQGDRALSSLAEPTTGFALTRAVRRAPLQSGCCWLAVWCPIATASDSARHSRTPRVSLSENGDWRSRMSQPWMSAETSCGRLGVTRDTVYSGAADPGLATHTAGRRGRFRADDSEQRVRRGETTASSEGRQT